MIKTSVCRYAQEDAMRQAGWHRRNGISAPVPADCMGQERFLSRKEKVVMPDINDYHAFECTSGGSSGGSSGSNGSPGCLTWVFAAISILWVIGKIFG